MVAFTISRGSADLFLKVYGLSVKAGKKPRTYPSTDGQVRGTGYRLKGPAPKRCHPAQTRINTGD